MKQKVLDFINKKFVPGSVGLEDCTFLPGGVVVKDNFGDQILFYYDGERECMMCAEQGRPPRIVY